MPLMHDQKPDSSNYKLSESLNGSEKISSEEQPAKTETHLQSKKGDMANGKTKDYNKSGCKKKEVLPKLSGRKYSLRSLDSGRILRSMAKAVNSKTPNSSSKPENLVSARKTGKKTVNKSCKDELSGIRNHIRYLMNRMNYEQSLIDAYSSEGWKGLSLEKIRPEKELERAKSEILRCKLRIRGIFQRLHTLLSEGRLHESLFDPDGINSENIFCGKCGAKDVSTDNDIILCDGICERGFHQKCLNPPLLSEDIPAEGEEWFCPQCNCKIYCVDLLNEYQGTDLSIEDSWDSIFPEAAAFANGNKQADDHNLPSDDSEDDDYDPDVPGFDIDEEEEENDEESSYKESDSSFSSQVSPASGHNMNEAISKLSTDDSEDEDFDPNAPDPDSKIYKTKSSSDESDFTSDSDEFCAEFAKKSCTNEDCASSQPILDLFADTNGHNMEHKDISPGNPKIHCIMVERDKQESCLRSFRKRNPERLDYEKLYAEAYGKVSYGSSDDEEWNELITPKKMKKKDKREFEEVVNYRFARTPQKLQTNAATLASDEHSPSAPHSSCFSSATVQRSQAASQELYTAFQEKQYPTREKRKSQAQELGMTLQQVNKCFGNARHRSHVSANVPLNADRSGTDKFESIDGVPSVHETDTELIQRSRSPASPLKSNHCLSQESPGAAIKRNGASSEKGKKAIVNKEVNDRQKAIAKEMRRMKMGR